MMQILVFLFREKLVSDQDQCFQLRKVKENLRNPYPEKKWVILIELAITRHLIDIGCSLGPC